MVPDKCPVGDGQQKISFVHKGVEVSQQILSSSKLGKSSGVTGDSTCEEIYRWWFQNKCKNLFICRLGVTSQSWHSSLFLIEYIWFLISNWSVKTHAERSLWNTILLINCSSLEVSINWIQGLCKDDRIPDAYRVIPIPCQKSTPRSRMMLPVIILPIWRNRLLVKAASTVVSLRWETYKQTLLKTASRVSWEYGHFWISSIFGDA